MPTEAQPQESRQALAVLTELIQLEYETMATYRAAFDRVGSVDARSELAVCFNDHEGAVHALWSFVERYGGEPDSCGDLERAWTRGSILLADVHDDDGVLSALDGLEQEGHRAYERAREDLRAIADVPLTAAFDSALADDERHRERLQHAGDPVKPA